MWFEDLTRYENSQVAASSAPIVNVGWLQNGHPFSSGGMAPSVVERLYELVEYAATNATRGKHYCDLCPETDRDSSRAWGHAEIRVVGADGVRYAAPTLIHHYVTVHGYQPPQSFVDALMRVADLRWEVARERDLCFGCGSRMARVRSEKGVRIVDGRRDRVIEVGFDCETCGTVYGRMFAGE